MKIKKSQLRQVIKEERKKLLQELGIHPPPGRGYSRPGTELETKFSTAYYGDGVEGNISGELHNIPKELANIFIKDLDLGTVKGIGGGDGEPGVKSEKYVVEALLNLTPTGNVSKESDIEWAMEQFIGYKIGEIVRELVNEVKKVFKTDTGEIL